MARSKQKPKSFPTVKLVLAAAHVEAEKQAITTLAKTEGVSVSNYLRRLVREAYRLGCPMGQYTPELFADNVGGGDYSDSPAFQKHLQAIRARKQIKSIKKGKTNE